MSESPRIDLEADFPTDFDAEIAADPPTSPDEAAATVESADEAPPVVVIQYRNRGIPPVLMFPLALVLSLGMFAAYHFLIVRPRNQELQQAAIRAAAVARAARPTDEATDSKPEPEPEPSLGQLAGIPLPLTLESQPLPLGFKLPPPGLTDKDLTAAAAADAAAKGKPRAGEAKTPADEKSPEAVAEVKPAEPAAPTAPPLAVGFSRPEAPPAEPVAKADPKADPEAVAVVAAAPKPDRVAKPPRRPAVDKPPPTQEEMIEQIQREEAAKAAKKEEMKRRKEEARELFAAEAQDRTENERSSFRKALYDIVSTDAPDAGRRIDDLCNQFGRDYGDELRDRVTGYLTRVHGRISRESEVRLLRSLGVPEPGILDFLAHGVKMSVNSRNGPRGPDEVRVIAAKQLLRVGLTTTKTDAARASSAMPTHPGR